MSIIPTTKIIKPARVAAALVQREESRKLASSAVALVIATAIGSILLGILGFSPIQVYRVVFSASFQNAHNFAVTIGHTIPLIFTGLAVAIPARGGLLNIGGEGQFVMGAFAATLIGIYVKGLPGIVHLPLCLLAAAATGALLAFIPAVLKLRANASEIVTTVLLNSICLLLAEYLVNYPFRAPGFAPETVSVQTSALFPKIFGVSGAIVLAVVAAVVAFFMLFRSIWGFELRAVGLNPVAACYKGVNVSSASVLAMMIGGALSAVGGASHALGTYGRFVQGMSANYGFSGIAVSMMAFNNPIAILLSAFLISVLRVGGMEVDRVTGVPIHFIKVVEGLVIVFMALPSATATGLRLFRQGRLKGGASR